MLRILKFFQGILSLNKKLLAEEERQISEGYSITVVQDGPESYYIYRENDREVAIGTYFSALNDVKIFTNSFRSWDKPTNEALTPLEGQIIRRRLVRYFSCWGGVVCFDNSPVQKLSDIKEELVRHDIPFEDLDGVVSYSSTVEDEKARKGGFFN